MQRESSAIGIGSLQRECAVAPPSISSAAMPEEASARATLPRARTGEEGFASAPWAVQEDHVVTDLFNPVWTNSIFTNLMNLPK